MRGFTLIELLIVFVIGALLLSFVGPVAYQQYEKTLIIKEREQLNLLLSKSRSDALLLRASINLSLQGNAIRRDDKLYQQDWLFSYITFPLQELTVNAHGFWLQDDIVWLEHNVTVAKALNPEQVQSTTALQHSKPRVISP